MKYFVALVLLALAACCYGTDKIPKMTNSGNAAGRAELRKKLFQNYDKLNIPDDVSVAFGVSILALDANEEKSILESDAWLKYTWTDSRLKWDNSKNNIDALRIGSQEIWKPDITLYNSANLKDMMSCWESNPIVFSSGMVIWIPPCQINTHCNFTLDKYPYGAQKCQWKFGSWTYDANLMDMELYEGKKEADLDYFGSNEWKILGTKATRNEKTYPCCVEPYTDITVDLNIQRHEHFTCKHNEL